MHLRSVQRRPSPAMIVAMIALIVALGGTAVAAKNLVSGSKIKKNSLPANRLKKNSLTSTQINETKLGAVPNATNAANASNAAHATAADSVSTLTPIPTKRVAATPGGADLSAAQAAAPEVPLAANGALTIYGKCYSTTGPVQTYMRTYIRTTQPGTVVLSNGSNLAGPVFLDPSTGENNRFLESDNIGANAAYHGFLFQGKFDALAPDGSHLQGNLGGWVKNGTLPGSQGVYGAGDVCMFDGYTVSDR